MADFVGLRLLGGILLLLSNGFFVTTEFALTRIRQFSESEFDGDPGLERAWEMTERLEVYLSGCQVGITVSSIGLGIVAEPALARLFDPVVRALGVPSTGTGHTAVAVALAFVLINLLHVVVGEQAPTYLGIERTKQVARYGATPLYYWTRATSPLIIGADRVAKALLGLFGVSIDRAWAEAEEGEPSTRAELRREMGQTLSEMGLTRERTREVMNALEIGRTQVRETMVPRDDVVPLSTAEPFEENLRRLEEHPHVRYPLVGETLEDYEGIVYAPSLLRHFPDEADNDTLREASAPPMTVAGDTSVADLIDQFQTQKQELALVLEGDEVVGLVTATDAFETITGELEDPLD